MADSSVKGFGYQFILSYDGADFCGFQIQPNVRTVEGEVRSAVSRVLGPIIRFSAAGRTDAGVHAVGQVVGVWVARYLSVETLRRALPALLPADIGVVDMTQTDAFSDVRRSAIAREYQYLFSAEPIPRWLSGRVVSVRFTPDPAVANETAAAIVGVFDFSNFCNLDPSMGSPIRNIYACQIEPMVVPDLYGNSRGFRVWRMTILANAFLYRMVRHLMGAIFEVLAGRQPLEKFLEMVHNPTARTFQYAVSPAHGLCLTRVDY